MRRRWDKVINCKAGNNVRCYGGMTMRRVRIGTWLLIGVRTWSLMIPLQYRIYALSRATLRQSARCRLLVMTSVASPAPRSMKGGNRSKKSGFVSQKSLEMVRLMEVLQELKAALECTVAAEHQGKRDPSHGRGLGKWPILRGMIVVPGGASGLRCYIHEIYLIIWRTQL